MDTTTLIQQQIRDNPVILYMKGSPDFPQCGFSGRAVQLLKSCGLTHFAHVNILEQPEIRKILPTLHHWPTFPQLYINGELVGGSDIMLELYEKGELQKLLTPYTEKHSA